MNMWAHKKQTGFTIVELAIVIIIIAILATITMVVYGNVQEKARDTQRITDMKNISEALTVYKNSKKALPNEQGSNWEKSTDTHSNGFIAALKTSGLVGEVPVDPVNDSSHYYRYYLYTEGYYGCDANKGVYFILQIVNGDKSSGERAESNPGFSCSGRNWTNEAWYTTGGFLYE